MFWNEPGTLIPPTLNTIPVAINVSSPITNTVGTSQLAILSAILCVLGFVSAASVTDLIILDINELSKVAVTSILITPLDETVPIIKAMQDAARRAVNASGDGTSSSMVLIQSMVNEGMKLIEDGANPIDLKRGIDLAVSEVVNRLKEKASEVFAWLERGAHLYICGDANRMAKDVHQALLEIIAEQGAKSPEQAEEYLKQLRSAKRYQKDVY